jgi:hypothetical protein
MAARFRLFLDRFGRRCIVMSTAGSGWSPRVRRRAVRPGPPVHCDRGRRRRARLSATGRSGTRTDTLAAVRVLHDDEAVRYADRQQLLPSLAGGWWRGA